MSPTTEAPNRIAGGVSGSKGGSTQGKGAAEGENGGGKKKSMKMKLGVLVLVLLLVVVGAKETVLKKKPVAAGKAAAAAKPVPGPMIPLTEQTLNLAGGHFLRVIAVIVTTKGTSATLDVTEGNQAVIDQFSNLPESALTGTVARNKAKKQLVARLEKLYPKKIEDIVYTEFVMQ
jgi:flagellar basal body-associated protein FliL